MAAVESSTEVVARAAMQPRVINRTSAGSYQKMWESELIIFAIPWPKMAPARLCGPSPCGVYLIIRKHTSFHLVSPMGISKVSLYGISQRDGK